MVYMRSAGTRQLLASRNRQLARKVWREALTNWHRRTLTELTVIFRFSVALGDLLLLDGNWYVTHTGLIRLARRNRCAGIRVELVEQFCDSKVGRWCFRATVFTSSDCKGFTGHGDADPSTVPPF